MYLRNIYRTVLDWLMRIGLGNAVLAITTFSIVVSLLISGTAATLFMPYLSFAQWGYVAILAPATIAPIVGYVVMSLAYQLAATQAALLLAATTDTLTGIGNRRLFFDIASRELAYARRNNLPLSVLLLDHFKQLNDRFGHAAGDDALVKVAHSCKARLRETDLLCRWGGEEFIVLLQKTPQETACKIADELRRCIASLTLEHCLAQITASIGVIEVHPGMSDLDAAVAAADQQLYRAKSTGRNRVMSPST